MMILLNGWIPTTTSLPSRLEGKGVSDEVIVTLANNKVTMMKYDYEEEMWYRGEFPLDDGVEVIAWTFSPDPYQPELEGALFIQGPLIPDED